MPLTDDSQRYTITKYCLKRSFVLMFVYANDSDVKSLHKDKWISCLWLYLFFLNQCLILMLVVRVDVLYGTGVET